jgi:methylthioribose-1-phosphate isomerase
LEYKSIEWIESSNSVRMLDQRILPGRVEYLDYTSAEGVAFAIKDMVIRGAPAIGAAAAYGLAVELRHQEGADLKVLWQIYEAADDVLRRSRPTAVNLFWALDRMANRANDTTFTDAQEFKDFVLSQAHTIAREDVETCKQIGLNALELVPEKAKVIHHCNTGGLATVAYGTALGIIRTAHEHGRAISVLVDETRPRLQGARLTCWELQQLGIPHKLIVDGASGFYMKQGDVDFCVVGCDRIAANGDTANKIGTYNLALVAHAHNIPFYVAGPTTTIDLSTASGDDIDIEERVDTEVVCVGDERIAPEETEVGNPAFDVTSAKYITAIITEKGIVRPPYVENLRALFD